MSGGAGVPWPIPLSLLAALALAIVPLPAGLALLRPEWVALVLIYWAMAFPQRVGVFTAFGAGLLLDVLQGQLLGQNAVAMALVAYLTIQLHSRLRVYPLWQQMIVVTGLIALYKLTALWPQGLAGLPPGTPWYWAPVLSSALIWPLIFVLLRDVRKRWLLHLT
ncbi:MULTISPECIES: rod shape-determining protein MreD [unclassified Thioalkalivibrio]|uniref:rod shape-determining protein MreD n=1 Tax=unclassified Thioalkalivibrio TaxID=2621013 RepID=UPI000365542D|nr:MULTISPECIES: rod shape-determining protein MreD [unclassified Thioalkalivibrio]